MNPRGFIQALEIVGVLNIHISRLNTIQHVILAILTSELDPISESSQDNQTGKRKLSLFTEGTIFYAKKSIKQNQVSRSSPKISALEKLCLEDYCGF